MGGLFSSKRKVRHQNTLTPHPLSHFQQHLQEESRNDIQTNANRIQPSSVVSPSSNFSSRTRPSTTNISNETYKIYQQILCSEIFRNSTTFINWSSDISSNANYRLFRLESSSVEYSGIVSKFSTHRSVDIRIVKIERVENIYLFGQYFLKKLEYLNKGLPVNEETMFHGTKRQFVDSICKNNFDWRLHGRTNGNIFGKGVSFTPKSSYANNYCDRQNKVMIVVKVLVSNTCEGNKYMVIPNYFNRQRLLRYDTSIKPGANDVFVKYSDDEFYPAYLIHYTGKMSYKKGFPR